MQWLFRAVVLMPTLLFLPRLRLFGHAGPAGFPRASFSSSAASPLALPALPLPISRNSTTSTRPSRPPTAVSSPLPYGAELPHRSSASRMVLRATSQAPAGAKNSLQTCSRATTSRSSSTPQARQLATASRHAQPALGDSSHALAQLPPVAHSQTTNSSSAPS